MSCSENHLSGGRDDSYMIDSPFLTHQVFSLSHMVDALLMYCHMKYEALNRSKRKKETLNEAIPKVKGRRILIYIV